MKKIINILFCFGLLLQNFAFMMPVFADGDKPTFTLKNLIQDDTTLKKEGDYYLVSGFDEIQLDYSVQNYTTGNYAIIIEHGTSSWITYYTPGYNYFKPDFELSFDVEYPEYSVTFCEDANHDLKCDNETEPQYIIKLKLVNYDSIMNGRVYITNVNQGGKDVELDNDEFTLNDAQKITFSLGGTNLIDDATYTVSVGDEKNEKEYLGSELEAGIDYVYFPEQGDYLNPYFELSGITSNSIGYFDGEDILDVSFNLYTDDTIGYYFTDLVYANNQNIPFMDYENDNDDEYSIVSYKYHDDSKMLAYIIDGHNYQNKVYQVKVDVLADGEEFYSETFNVNGTLLNNDYKLELVGLDLSDEPGAVFSFNINIDGIEKKHKNVTYSSTDFTVNRVIQDDTTLKIVDGKYVANSFRDLYFDITLTNPNDSNARSYIWIQKGDGSGNGSRYTENEYFKTSPYLSEVGEYNLFLCKDDDCNQIYDSKTVYVKLARYNDLSNSRVVVSNFRQGGNKIEMDEDWTFSFNDKQTITFTVTGENLIDDATYKINSGNFDYHEYLGSELENGVDIVYTNNGNNYMYISYYLESIYMSNYSYFDGENYYTRGFSGGYYHDFDYDFYHDDNVPTYTAKLFYTNYPNIQIARQEYGEYYYINSNYHNNNNSLSYKINGQNFLDKNYNVNVVVTKNNENVKTINESVNGLSLNAGYNFELKGLTLALKTEIDSVYQDDGYEFTITINDIPSTLYADYNSLGGGAYISAQVILEEGSENTLMPYYGLDGGGVYQVNSGLFNKYKDIKIKYNGKGFDNNDTYSYTLLYGNFIPGDEDVEPVLNYVKTLTSSSVKGSVLNGDGLVFNYTDENNYDNVAFRLIIKKGDEILAYASPIFVKDSEPMIISDSLYANDRELELMGEEDDEYYSVSRGTPLDIKLLGMGFENDKNYQFEVCAQHGYGDETCQFVSVSGSAINEGNGIIHFDKTVPNGVDTFGLTYHSRNYEYGSIWGYFQISYVNVDEIVTIPAEKPYVINPNQGVIKNIIKNTDVSSLIEDLQIADDGYIKIFDKEEENEVLGKLGTGMVLVIYDKDGNELLSIDIVVKGDTTGDGDMSITDLVKVKRHVVGLSYLSGVYAIAGDVTGTGAIGVTDLVKMSRDVAGIEDLD